MDYETMRGFADSWGLLAMFTLFVGIVIYVLWPGDKNRYTEPANIPLREDEGHDKP